MALELLEKTSYLLNRREGGTEFFSYFFQKLPKYTFHFTAKKSFITYVKENFELFNHYEYLSKNFEGNYVDREPVLYYKNSDSIIYLVPSEEASNCVWYSTVDKRKIVDKYIYVPKYVKEDPPSSPFYMVLESDDGSLYTEEFDANFDFTDFDLKRNYGKDFVKHHENIIKGLSEESTGLYLFHGLPGCGKTTYLKYLCSELRNHEVIFIPSNVYEKIDSPRFIKILMRNPESIFLLEDAERLLKSREDGENPLISTLLNLTDGIMGSAFKLRTILTFNCDRSKIDKALLRKGRLKYEYQFDKLPISDSQSLLNHLKIKHKATESMSLAEIYNFDKDNNAK